ncbi:MAG: DUF6249 domain-containing protein [Hyphomonadaceae bacterium]|nr:DUF6249 domain-containing protein [Hyphomonadaceae bacterium]
MSEILIPLGLWVMIAVISVAAIWGNVVSRRELNETMRRAIDSGQKLDVEAISALHKPVRSVAQDLRGGVVLIFLAVGLIVAGLLAAGVIPGTPQWDDDAGIGFFVAASIVGFIGLGQFVAAMLRREKKKET